MNLNLLFGLNTPSAGNNSAGANNTFQASGPPADMTAFKAGQTIQGEVVALKNNEVILQLEDGGQIRANLTKDIQISVGQMMTFEVKSNNGFRLSLSPLFENMGHDPNVLKALNAAGLPNSARNLEMVSLLMRQGLPVDKGSLIDFSRQMNANAGTNPVTLAQMNRLELLTSPENVRQFEAYKNYEHQISSAVRDITDGLIKDIGQMVSGGDKDGAVFLFKQVLSIFGSDTQISDAVPKGNEGVQQMPGQVSAANTAGTTGTANVPMITGDDIVRIIGEQAKTEITAQGSAALGQDAALNPDGLAQNRVVSAAVLESANVLTAANPIIGQNAAVVPVDTASVGSTQPLATASDNAFLTLAELTSEHREQIVHLLREAGFSNALTDAVNTGDLNKSTLLGMIHQEISEGHINNDKLVELLNNKEFQAVIKNDINNQWLLKPEELVKEKQVEEHFSKVLEQTSKLIETLNQAGRAETPVALAANSLSSNINFVNQLNQMFTYIQIPLKMNSENTHSELFVYTNKKNLAKRDGNVSALLHLDMDNLGPLDIYIAMQNNHVSTKFYLSNDDVIDLVSKNIHILNDRLVTRGYQLNCDFITRAEDKKPFDEILEANKNVPIMANYSFDARA